MLELLLLAIFLSVTIAVLAVGLLLGSRSREALRRALRSRRAPDGQPTSDPGTHLSRLIRKLFRSLALLSPGSAYLRVRLLQAGYQSRTAPLTYSSLRVMLLIALPLLAFVSGLSITRSFQVAAAWLALGAVLALLGPPLVLRRQVRVRKLRIRKHLPDSLDLLVVCVEAGLALDAAILKVSRELSGSDADMAHEFRLVNQRVNAGMPRSDALREMSERTGVGEVHALVATLIQSERLGTSISRTLRLYADQLRTKRRQRAQEAAAKAPIKMLVPMMLFILPALFIIVLGPVVLALRDLFSMGLQ